ncbi:MAG: hypothetical protein R3F59_19025 [Myxococcota bacterium]
MTVALALACSAPRPAFPPAPPSDTAAENTDLGGHFVPEAPFPGRAHHACAIDAGGHVQCWGNAAAGQLGRGTFEGRLLDQDALVSVYRDGVSTDGQPALHAVAPVAGAWRAVQVAAGVAHTCAIDEEGAVWCWGRGVEGQVGPDTDAPRLDRRGWRGDVPSPARVPLPAPAAALFAGTRASCARGRDGVARCWGAGFAGIEEVGREVIDGWIGDPGRCLLHRDGVVACVGIPSPPPRPGARQVVIWGGRACTSDGTADVQCGTDLPQQWPGPIASLQAAGELCALVRDEVWCRSATGPPSRVASGVRTFSLGRRERCDAHEDGIHCGNDLVAVPGARAVAASR